MSTPVSNFEILYKPITPSIGDAALAQLGRRVLQGYFLTLTNLEEDPYRYVLTWVQTPPLGDGRRTLEVAVVITDVGGANTFSAPVNLGTNRFRSQVTLPPQSTALIVLLPNIGTPNFFRSPPSDIEVRGHVRIRLPRRSLTEAQSERPVRVLVAAEHRSTYLPNGWPAVSSGSLDFDQAAASVPLAAGAGEVSVPPDPALVFRPGDLVGLRPIRPFPVPQFPIELLAPDEVAGLMVESLRFLGSCDPEAEKIARALAQHVRLPYEVDDAHSPPADKR